MFIKHKQSLSPNVRPTDGTLKKLAQLLCQLSFFFILDKMGNNFFFFFFTLEGVHKHASIHCHLPVSADEKCHECGDVNWIGSRSTSAQMLSQVDVAALFPGTT